MSNDKEELDAKIREAKQQITRLQLEFGPDNVIVAQTMEYCAQLMRRSESRFWEATNLEAAAQAIRGKTPETGEVFDASVPVSVDTSSLASAYLPQEQPVQAVSESKAFAPIDDSFWDKTVVVEFTGTMYLPNQYTVESNLHDLEVLAYAYENSDPFARASISSDDATRVWGWIVKKRTGRYPDTLELIDKKAKRLRRRELGPIAETIDCRVTPLETSSSQASSSHSSQGSTSRDIHNRKSVSNNNSPNVEDAAKHIQAAAEIIGNIAADGLKEAAQLLQEAAQEVDLKDAKQGLQDLTKNAQIIAGSAELELRKWLKNFKKDDEK